jgi:hypothetical protein
LLTCIKLSNGKTRKFQLLIVISRWAGHVARMGEGRGVHRVLVGKPVGSRPLGRSRRRRIILRWMFWKWKEVVGTGWSKLRTGTGSGHL